MTTININRPCVTCGEMTGQRTWIVLEGVRHEIPVHNTWGCREGLLGALMHTPRRAS